MEDKKKIYIAGAISGLPAAEYTRLFEAAEKQLQAQGFTTISPLRIGIQIDPSSHTAEEVYRAHQKADICELTKCSAIYMLANWQYSEGAILEHEIATALGLYIYYEEEPKHPGIKKAIRDVMGVPFKYIAQESRQRWHVYARMIYTHHCKKEGDNTKRIAEEIHHDESSVGYYLRHYDDEYKYNHEFRKAAEKVATILSRRLKNIKPMEDDT